MVVPQGRIILVRYKWQFSADDAESMLNRFISADQYHVEEVGEGYIITVNSEVVGDFVFKRLQLRGVICASRTLASLMNVNSTGNPELDKAIKNSLIQVYGQPG